jgi:hypothetical protein
VHINPNECQIIRVGVEKDDMIAVFGREINEDEWQCIRMRLKNSNAVYENCLDVILTEVDMFRKEGG